MKGERRHELERNELADWLTNTAEDIKPFQNAILGVVLLLVVALLGYWWWSGQWAGRNAAGWDAVYRSLSKGELNRADLEAVKDDYPDTDAADCARVMAADMHMAIGCDMLFSDRAAANSELRQAVEQYLAVRQITPRWWDAVRILRHDFATMPWYAKGLITALVGLIVFGLLTVPFMLGGYLARKLGRPGYGVNIGLMLFCTAAALMVVVARGLPQVVDSPRVGALRQRATFGLARARESQGSLEKAMEHYEEVGRNWPEGAYAAAAARRLEDLKKTDTKLLYDRFARFDPKPVSSPEPGGPGERLPFDIDTLPDDGSLFEPKMPDLQEKGVEDEKPEDSPDTPGKPADTQPEGTGTESTDTEPTDTEPTDKEPTGTKSTDPEPTNPDATSPEKAQPADPVEPPVEKGE